MCVLTDGKYFPGYTVDNEDYPSSKVSAISKTEVKQDNHHHTEDYGYQQHCPEPADIDPCVCTYHSIFNAMDIDCSAIESEEQLRHVFQSDFPSKKFRRFTIKANYNLKVLESD